ncbi:hypothetical protein [Lewinella sp. IMCC34183]|uniref:hypothetical protein n=1 Tax=Lewinella sp. IMCC34183 TaxID=2248762 RepID=UPI000E24F9E6|nr:hypothetical protein [Lewinella sp. IMCC34183]
MKHCYFLFPLLTLLFFSCGRPLRVVRVAPSTEESIDRYEYGNPIQRRSVAGTDVEINYYDASREYLVFDLVVTNRGTSDVLFDPATARLLPEGGPFLPAIDPEFQLLSMDLDDVRQQRTARTLAWVGAAVLVGTAVYAATSTDVSTVTDNGDQAYAQLGASVADAATVAIWQREAARSGQVSDLPAPDNRFFWLDYSMRKTTIRPGESAMGKLVFPRADESERLTVSVLTGGEDVRFSFTQMIYR